MQGITQGAFLVFVHLRVSGQKVFVRKQVLRGGLQFGQQLKHTREAGIRIMVKVGDHTPFAFALGQVFRSGQYTIGLRVKTEINFAALDEYLPKPIEIESTSGRESRGQKV